MKRKVCVVVTARPSYSRIKSALFSLRERPDVELQLVVTASALVDRYGQVERQMRDDGLEINARIHTLLEGDDPSLMAKTTGIGIIELATAFDHLQPDVVVSIADRYETLATATAASYMGIPLAHIQGGEVTGSIDERVRHAVTKLADLHLTATQRAKNYIIRMGEDPSNVINTGCPSLDLINEVVPSHTLDFDVFELYKGVGPRLDLERGFIIVMLHPVTSESNSAKSQTELVLEAVSELSTNVLWFWPNVDAGSERMSKAIRVFRETRPEGGIHFFKSLAPHHFLKLLGHSQMIIGNSSVAIREGAFLGVPAVNIGSRQEGRERGPNVVDVEFDKSQLLEAVAQQLVKGRFSRSTIYGDGQAGPRISEILATHEFSCVKTLSYPRLDREQLDNENGQ